MIHRIDSLKPATIYASEHIKYAMNPANLTANKIKKLTLGFFTITVISTIPMVNGGPWVGSAALIACLGLIEVPPLFGACLVAAGAAYALPTPLN